MKLLMRPIEVHEADAAREFVQQVLQELGLPTMPAVVFDDFYNLVAANDVWLRLKMLSPDSLRQLASNGMVNHLLIFVATDSPFRRLYSQQHWEGSTVAANRQISRHVTTLLLH